MPLTPLPTTLPEITLTSSGLFSSAFQQLYSSYSGAIQQAQSIFIQGNQLEERWKEPLSQKKFTLAELGFGAAINWMATLECWKKSHAYHSGWLHYIAIEKHPFPPSQLGRNFPPYQHFPNLYQALCDHFPPAFQGFHHRNIPDYRSTLLCIWMDALEGLQELCNPIDAWFLDGFSPKENPTMWSQGIATQLARLSHADTTLATYSVASIVKKNLCEAGFSITKKPGLPPKKERLEGQYIANKAPPYFRTTLPAYYCFPPPNLSENPTIAIIGAGIMGHTLAHTLSRHTNDITLFDPALETAASHNPAGMIMPILAEFGNDAVHFHFHAFLHTQYTLKNIDDFWHPDGIELHNSNAQIFLTHPVWKEFLSTHSSGHTEFHHTGWVNPRAWKEHLKNHSHATHKQNTIAFIERREGKWNLYDPEQKLLQSADHVILANSFNAPNCLIKSTLPITKARGQITQIQEVKANTTNHARYNNGHYHIPLSKRESLYGATFTRHDEHSEGRTLDDISNLSAWETEAYTSLKNRVGFRAVTPDRTPIIGAAIDEAQCLDLFSDLQHGKHWKIYPTAPSHTNLWVASGLGARGLTTAALSAEFLSSLLFGTPLPIPQSLTPCLHPARFLIRKLKRHAGVV